MLHVAEVLDVRLVRGANHVENHVELVELVLVSACVGVRACTTRPDASDRRAGSARKDRTQKARPPGVHSIGPPAE